MITYAQSRADFEYLESIAEVEDMVVIDAGVWTLMRNPTQSEAGKLYRSAITLWFNEHSGRIFDDEKITEIADRHGEL